MGTKETLELGFEEQQGFGGWVLENFAPAHTDANAGHGVQKVGPLGDDTTVHCTCGFSIVVTYNQYVELTKQAA